MPIGPSYDKLKGDSLADAGMVVGFSFALVHVVGLAPASNTPQRGVGCFLHGMEPAPVFSDPGCFRSGQNLSTTVCIGKLKGEFYE